MSALPAAVRLAGAPPHEAKLAEAAAASRFLSGKPEKPAGGNAGGSGQLDKELLEKRGIEMTAPHRRNRKRPRAQDGRAEAQAIQAVLESRAAFHLASPIRISS